MSGAFIETSNGSIQLGELPEADLENGDWNVRGSIYEDRDLDSFHGMLEEVLAIYLKKKATKDKVARVARHISQHRGMYCEFDGNPKSYGYAFWTSVARDIIDMVNE